MIGEARKMREEVGKVGKVRGSKERGTRKGKVK